MIRMDHLPDVSQRDGEAIRHGGKAGPKGAAEHSGEKGAFSAAEPPGRHPPYAEHSTRRPYCSMRQAQGRVWPQNMV